MVLLSLFQLTLVNCPLKQTWLSGVVPLHVYGIVFRLNQAKYALHFCEKYLIQRNLLFASFFLIFIILHHFVWQSDYVVQELHDLRVVVAAFLVAEVDLALVNQIVVVALHPISLNQVGRELGACFGLLGLWVFLAEVGQQILLKKFVDGLNLFLGQQVLLGKVDQVSQHILGAVGLHFVNVQNTAFVQIETDRKHRLADIGQPA